MHLTDEEYRMIATETDGYSGSDLSALAREAAMVALREAFARAKNRIGSVEPEDVRDVTKADFDLARTRVTPSVSADSLLRIEAWERKKGKKTPPPPKPRGGGNPMLNPNVDIDVTDGQPSGDGPASSTI